MQIVNEEYEWMFGCGREEDLRILEEECFLAGGGRGDAALLQFGGSRDTRGDHGAEDWNGRNPRRRQLSGDFAEIPLGARLVFAEEIAECFDKRLVRLRSAELLGAVGADQPRLGQTQRSVHHELRNKR